MAEKLDVEVTGQSKYQVANAIAIAILRKEGKDYDRTEYLRTIAQAIKALAGVEPGT